MPPPASTSALSERELAALSEADAYPDDPSAGRIERVETHLSQVFLSGERVYKFRKAVDLGFVCFASRAERNADCLREVALNRRLAPDVYLGVAPLWARDGGARIGPLGETLRGDAEHCVVMRRLPAGRDALSLLERGALGTAHLDRVAHAVARFHASHGLGTPAPFSPEAWRERCQRPVAANLALLAESGDALAPPAVLAALRDGVAAFEARWAGRFEHRRIEGRAVDAHGDLHLQHVWFERDDAEPLLIDCLEFNEALRCIDAASEVAFLAMDLVYRDAERLAARFLRVYAAERDDFDLFGVVDYFASYRAAVRAKVAAIAARDASIGPEQRAHAGDSARRHLALAASALERRTPGRLVLVGGAVGTGKSTTAAELGDELLGAVVSSDRVRKHLLGLAPTERAGAAAYTPERKARVYAGLLERAEPIVASGRPAVLDATWGSRREREAALAWAGKHGVEAFFLEARCPAEVARSRLARRRAEGRDASDAGPELQRASAALFEPPDEWPEDARATLDTHDPAWRSRLASLAQALREPQARGERTS